MARTASETGKSSRKPATKPAAPRAAANPRRQRLWRDLALIAVAPLLLFLLASLVTYSPADPGWSHSGSITAPLQNACGRVGAWIADVLLYLTGYVAFLLPIVLGAIAWIALFGMDSDGDGDADLGPALRLVGIVGFLVASCGLLYLRISGSNDFSAGSGGILGQLTGRSLLRGFGPVGANLFLVSLFLISVTLATGLSWLAVMDRIGAFALSLPGLLTRGARKGAQQANDWSEARAFREERVEARKVDSELRAKREKVRIEPPPAPVAPPQVVVVRTPQPMYECITPDGERYTSETGDGNPRWVPLWTLGYRSGWGGGGRPGTNTASDRLNDWNDNRPLGGRVGARTPRGPDPSSSPGPDRPRPPHRPPPYGVGGGGTWVRDACHALPQGEVCARLSDRREELRRRFFNAQESERNVLRREERGLNARLAADCGVR